MRGRMSSPLAALLLFSLQDLEDSGMAVVTVAYDVVWMGVDLGMVN